MLDAKQLISKGVSKRLAETFVTVNFPQTGTGGLTGAERAAVEQTMISQGLIKPGPTTGGASPGVRDNPGGSETYPNQPGKQPTDPTGNPGDPNDPASGSPPIDWRMYLSDWGFDADVVNELDNIFKKYSDPNQAAAAALAYIRGTDWYKRTFAGIGEGIKNGLIRDEQDYRSYVNDVNQYYRRFFGRDATINEIALGLQQGKSASMIGAHFQGQALVNAQLPDIQYALGAFDENGRATDDQLSQYGDSLAGLSNMVGPQLDQRLQKARQRLATIMQGTLATPSVALLNRGGLAATSLGGGTPDIGS